MRNQEPAIDLDSRYSAPGAQPTEWKTGRDELAGAGTYWLTTVRPDGRPHVTPVLAVWYDGALHFCTGEEERKFRNLEANSHCVLTTGNNTVDEGLDVVLEGEAVPVRDDGRLRRLADAWVEKYGEEWRFEARDGAFHHVQGGRAVVFEVVPATVFGFRKGDYSQTRWRFAAAWAGTPPRPAGARDARPGGPGGAFRPTVLPDTGTHG